MSSRDGVDALLATHRIRSTSSSSNAGGNYDAYEPTHSRLNCPLNPLIYAIPPRHSASNSHQENEAYMLEFDAAFITLAPPSASSSSSNRPAPMHAYSRSSNSLQPPPPSHAHPSTTLNQQKPRTSDPHAPHPPPTHYLHSEHYDHPPSVLHSPRGALPTETKGWVPWRSGPSNPQGRQCDLSDRPSLCSAAHWERNEVVIGSSDHALYLMDAKSGKRKRTLYTKNAGHTEWVTACCFLPDGKIVSGGMDSKLWLWQTGSTRGIAMDGHFGAISKLGFWTPSPSDPYSGVVCSASYDKTVRLWTIGSRGSELATLKGHDAPVTELSLGSERGILSGDRSGNVILWDAAVSSGFVPDAADGRGEAWKLKGIHRGHITSLAWWNNSHEPNFGGLFLSGGQDGVLRVWDRRNKSNAAKIQLHVNEKGHGAVSNICAGRLPSSQGFIVTAGADGTVRVLDPRKSFSPIGQPIQLTNFPYSLAAVPYNGTGGGLVCVGCGDGSIHVIDIATVVSSSKQSSPHVSSSSSLATSRPPWSSGSSGKGEGEDREGERGTTLYALGAHKGAVRTIEVCEDRLMSSGDDGKTMLYFLD